MQSRQPSGVLNIAVTAAREAGNVINQNIHQTDRLSVSKKNSDEFVSELDLIAEDIIVETLQKHYPDYNIIAEERGEIDHENEFTWIIDPLDGTHNFLRGNPHCCISIALKKADEVISAVIYDPFRNELFTANRGSGAQLDGRRIRMSANNKLRDSLLVTEFPYRSGEKVKPWLKSFARILPRAQSINRTGSSALDLAYLACGRYDGMWAYGLKNWDIAAGRLLVSEAGGLITDIDGESDAFKTGNIIAASAALHEKLHHLINHLD